MKQIWQEFVINASVDSGSYLTSGDPQTQTLYQSLIQSWILDIITFMITKLVFTEFTSLSACELWLSQWRQSSIHVDLHMVIITKRWIKCYVTNSYSLLKTNLVMNVCKYYLIKH